MKKAFLIIFGMIVFVSSNSFATYIRFEDDFFADPPTTKGGPWVLNCHNPGTCGILDDESCIFYDNSGGIWRWEAYTGPLTEEQVNEIDEQLHNGGLEAYPIDCESCDD